jgi:hypothetical protein
VQGNAYITIKKFALMLKYNSTKQLEIFEFEHPFQTDLDPGNRWVKLSKLLPWDELVDIYSQSLSRNKGKYGIDGRLAVGCLIIKHKLGLSDREVIETLKENIYLQYFVGFKGFKKEAAFDASLFVEIRKRMGSEKFDQMNEAIIRKSEEIRPGNKKRKKNNESNDDNNQSGSKGIKKSGKLKIDATVSDQMIAFPTDLGLLNNARKESERLIDLLYKESGIEKKPRTYRKEARKAYLSISKKKRKTKSEIRKAVGKQIRYLRRNISSIHKLLDLFEGKSFPLTARDQKILWVIQLLYSQQEEMYREKKHTISNRIVNIYQPYVRPIPRGKEKVSVEFGAKLGVSEVEGFVRINNLSWEAYNESTDLKMQVEEYREQYGCYPETVLADKIYPTRDNRNWLKALGIRINGKPLGRPPENESYYKKNKRRKENNQRNHIEGKFGQAKNAYGLSRIRSRRQDTSESWISAIFFTMNLVKLAKIANIFIKFTLQSIKTMQAILKHYSSKRYLEFFDLRPVKIPASY